MMSTHHLGFIGLEDNTVNACLSMLKLIESGSSFHWHQSEPDNADVLMVSGQQPETARHYLESKRPCIVIYSQNEQAPAFPFTLQHPFRATQLKDVLDKIGEQLPTH